MNIRSLTDGPLNLPTAQESRDAMRLPPDTRPISVRLKERERDRASLNRKSKRYYDPFPDRDSFAPDPVLGSPILMPGTDHFIPGCGITPAQGGNADYEGPEEE
jgi:hypothetical protein